MSRLIIDIKPWDSEVDLEELEHNLKTLAQQSFGGVVWEKIEREPGQFGESRLLAYVIMDDESRYEQSIEDWIVEELEDYVQSAEVISSVSLEQEEKRKQKMVEPCFEYSDRLTGRLQYAAYGIRGFRSSMEDVVMIQKHQVVGDIFQFAVFDGHGGSQCAEFLAANWAQVEQQLGFDYNPEMFSDNSAIENLFLKLDSIFEEVQIELHRAVSLHTNVGSTANVLTVRILSSGDMELICSNCGDSRSVFWDGKTVQPLSQDHKPSRIQETKRIEAAGGYVKNGRVQDELAISRSFGDYYFKSAEAVDSRNQMVIAVPDISRVTLGRTTSYNHSFVLMASDGVWDVMSNEDAVQFVKERLEQRVDVNDICRLLCEVCCQEKNSQDNISVIVVLFN